MLKALLTLFATLLTLTGFAQATYAGNGNTGLGGYLGGGSLSLETSGSNVLGIFTEPTATLGSNVLVIYIDSRAGGFTSTANFTDVVDPDNDGVRPAISGLGDVTANRALINFPAGFEPDYAMALSQSTQGFFQLRENIDHLFLDFVQAGFVAGTRRFSIPYSALGTDEATGFTFVATLLTPSDATRSDEFLVTPFTTGNPGSPSTLTLSPASVLLFNTAAMPVGLVDFTASVTPARVRLDWSTAFETDNDGFGIERSADGSTWREIAWVAGFGESSQLRAYSYTDREVTAGMRYYRLRQQDHDGRTAYSDVVSAAFAKTLTASLEVQSLATNGTFTVRNVSEAAREIRFISLHGQELARTTLGAGSLTELSAVGLASGIYLLSSGSETYKMVVR